MTISIAELDGKIAAEAAQIPSMYGSIDFSMTPERFTVTPGDQTDLAPEFAARRPVRKQRDFVLRIGFRITRHALWTRVGSMPIRQQS